MPDRIRPANVADGLNHVENEMPLSRIDAAAAWLIADDSAYAAQPDAARRAAREMLDAADLADEEDIGPRLAAARERAIAVLNEPSGKARSVFIECLAAETKLPADEKLAACADRILADLYVRGYLVKRDFLGDHQ